MMHAVATSPHDLFFFGTVARDATKRVPSVCYQEKKKKGLRVFEWVNFAESLRRKAFLRGEGMFTRRRNCGTEQRAKVFCRFSACSAESRRTNVQVCSRVGTTCRKNRQRLLIRRPCVGLRDKRYLHLKMLARMLPRHLVAPQCSSYDRRALSSKRRRMPRITRIGQHTLQLLLTNKQQPIAGSRVGAVRVRCPIRLHSWHSFIHDTGQCAE